MSAPDAVIAARVAEVLSTAEYGAVVDSGDAPERDLWLGPRDNPDPLATFTRMFTLGVTARTDAFEAAISPMTPDEWVQGGLIAIDGDRAQPLVRIVPHAGHLLACDDPSRSDVAPADMIEMPTVDAAIVANLTLRPSAGEALVLEGGPGLQALLAAGHCEWTVAVREDPRGVRFVDFNGELNRVHNVGTMHGSSFEAVEGRTFDLVVSDRAFVLTPEDSEERRLLPADAEVVRTLRQGAGHLNEGGILQMFCTWTHERSQEWPAKLATWIEDFDCDAVLLVEDSVDPAVYAARWLGETSPSAPDRFSDEFDRWMRYYDDQGIEAIGFGFITLRKRAAPDNWMFVDTEIGSLSEVGSERVSRAFRTRDNLRELAEDQILLATHLQLAEDVRLHQVAQIGEDAWQGVSLEIRNDAGATGQIDPAMAQLLGRADGNRTAAELLTELAEGVGIARDEAFTQGVPILRNLIAAGFLQPS